MSAEKPSPELQAQFWNGWNHTFREVSRLDPATRYRSSEVLRTVASLSEGRSRILEVGCGSGWLCVELSRYGTVTGTDIANEVLARAQLAHPEVRFIAGDFLSTDVGRDYDLIVTMEVLSHVADQPLFARRLGELLKPGGRLVMTTQNRFVWERHDNVMPLGRGHLRRWLNRTELRQLLSPHFEIERMSTLLPEGHRGVLRVLNSVRLNALGGKLVGAQRLTRWKERAGLGQAIFVQCRKRDGH